MGQIVLNVSRNIEAQKHLLCVCFHQTTRWCSYILKPRVLIILNCDKLYKVTPGPNTQASCTCHEPESTKKPHASSHQYNDPYERIGNTRIARAAPRKQYTNPHSRAAYPLHPNICSAQSQLHPTLPKPELTALITSN